jgi:hypothetical protein
VDILFCNEDEAKEWGSSKNLYNEEVARELFSFKKINQKIPRIIVIT